MNDVYVIWPGISLNADFIEGGPFPNVDPHFADMTPEDEVSIKSAA
ncbi:MAG: hypothetical protein ACYC10_18285 [Allorhizobium sp.]